MSPARTVFAALALTTLLASEPMLEPVLVQGARERAYAYGSGFRLGHLVEH